MAEYVMVAQSEAMPGREDEYNDWYDNRHFHDICAIPGVLGGRRFEVTEPRMGEPGLKYLAIYDLDIESPEAFLAEIGRRGAEGLMPLSDAINMATTKLWVYRQNGAKS